MNDGNDSSFDIRDSTEKSVPLTTGVCDVVVVVAAGAAAVKEAGLRCVGVLTLQVAV